MSYIIADVNGPVSDFTNIAGLRSLHDEVRRNPIQYQRFWKFLRQGWGYLTPELIEEIKLFRDQNKGQRMREIVTDLLDAMDKSELIAIISQ